MSSTVATNFKRQVNNWAQHKGVLNRLKYQSSERQNRQGHVIWSSMVLFDDQAVTEAYTGNTKKAAEEAAAEAFFQVKDNYN